MEPHPTNTVSGDESTMAERQGCTDFPGRPTRCELRRISLPRTTVNRGRRSPRSSYARFISPLFVCSGRLRQRDARLVDEVQGAYHLVATCFEVHLAPHTSVVLRAAA